MRYFLNPSAINRPPMSTVLFIHSLQTYSPPLKLVIPSNGGIDLSFLGFFFFFLKGKRAKGAQPNILPKLLITENNKCRKKKNEVKEKATSSNSFRWRR